MKSSAKLEVQLIVDACLKGGITQIVLSPGSRNAPLSIAFDEHPAFTTFVVPDERAAAFYALGMAQQLQQPVAIACTSGSAPLNYFPAVAEAYYQGIPLVILTADRPKEWVDQGDGQTIVQENMYGSHVLAAVQLTAIHTDEQRWLFERQCAETIQKANGKRKGPVHLNIPFSEPLYGVTEDVQTIRQWMHYAEGETVLSDAEKTVVNEKWQRSTKRMVICGQMQHDPELEAALAKLAEDPSVVVIVEHLSNLRHPSFIQCTDRTLNQLPVDLKAFQPDLLVVLGGAIVSKRIKAFLRNTEGLEAIRIGYDFPFMDTFRALTFTSATNPVAFIQFLGTLDGKASSTFGTAWKQRSEAAIEKHRKYIDSCVFSDLKAMDTVWRLLPEKGHVHVANSSIIRYALLFEPKNNPYWCNRGTSGIDGSSSTACGAALMDSENLHVLLSGDMSFFYDSNAFWSSHKPANLRVVVFNNGGGDIFNIIPGPDTVPQREQYFVAVQQYSAEHICKAYGLDYCSATTIETIETQWDDFLKRSPDGRPKLMEIHTTGQENSTILRNYFLETKNA